MGRLLWIKLLQTFVQVPTWKQVISKTNVQKYIFWLNGMEQPKRPAERPRHCTQTVREWWEWMREAVSLTAAHWGQSPPLLSFSVVSVCTKSQPHCKCLQQLLLLMFLIYKGPWLYHGPNYLLSYLALLNIFNCTNTLSRHWRLLRWEDRQAATRVGTISSMVYYLITAALPSTVRCSLIPSFSCFPAPNTRHKYKLLYKRD